MALGVVIAVLVSVFGLFGFASADAAGASVSATVTAGAPCSARSATETVTFKHNGKQRTARFDGCGHAKGEPVEITVPAETSSPNLVVHSADAAVGATDSADQLGLLLIVLSGTAGATYAFIIRRGPKETKLPPALRLAN